MIVQGKLLTNQDDLSEVYNIRKKVFIDEMGISEAEVFNNLDTYAVHVLVYEGIQRKAVATGSMSYNGSLCYIYNVAVMKDARDKGYGDLAIRQLIGKAFSSRINTIHVKTTLDCRSFFERLGFKSLKEDKCYYNSPYIEMVLIEESYIAGCKRR
ncbi:MAG: GNAT family N-acetyltransferase [Clostridiales bacterium]|nr:GNAT family N-acetyltransferase [Clostridiales bacterium]